MLPSDRDHSDDSSDDLGILAETTKKSARTPARGPTSHKRRRSPSPPSGVGPPNPTERARKLGSSGSTPKSPPTPPSAPDQAHAQVPPNASRPDGGPTRSNSASTSSTSRLTSAPGPQAPPVRQQPKPIRRAQGLGDLGLSQTMSTIRAAVHAPFVSAAGAGVRVRPTKSLPTGLFGTGIVLPVKKPRLNPSGSEPLSDAARPQGESSSSSTTAKRNGNGPGIPRLTPSNFRTYNFPEPNEHQNREVSTLFAR